MSALSLFFLLWFHHVDRPQVILTGQGETEQAPHGQGNVYAPEVQFDGKNKVYRMWYGGQGKDGHDRISYMESTDGTTWVRKGVVVDNGTANHVNDPAVVVVDGQYYLYYTYTLKDVVDSIALATSRDGKTWDFQGVVLAPGTENAWDSLSVGRPSVLFENGRFHLWYDGRKDFPPGSPVQGVPISANSQRAVGYATSTDGIHWTRHAQDPVFGQNAGAVDVKRVGDQLVMLYESHEGTRYATSTDPGRSWTDQGFLMRKSGTAVDQFGHVTPFLWVDSAKPFRARLFVGAAPAQTWDHNQIAVYDLDQFKLPAR